VIGGFHIGKNIPAPRERIFPAGKMSNRPAGRLFPWEKRSCAWREDFSERKNAQFPGEKTFPVGKMLNPCDLTQK